jgi:hypothetical protein
VSEPDGDNAINVIDDDVLQLIPQMDDPVAVSRFVPSSISVTLLPRTTKGIDARIVVEESRRLILESVMLTEFACVEPVTLTCASWPSSKSCPWQTRKLLDIVTEACETLQVIVLMQNQTKERFQHLFLKPTRSNPVTVALDRRSLETRMTVSMACKYTTYGRK